MLFYSGMINSPLRDHEIYYNYLSKLISLHGHKISFRFPIKFFHFLDNKIKHFPLHERKIKDA